MRVGQLPFECKPAYAELISAPSTTARRRSHRRMNLHLCERAARGGCLIVDTTRRVGKTLPDSFAKTVPIWAVCINRAASRVAAANPSADVGRMAEASPTRPGDVEVCSGFALGTTAKNCDYNGHESDTHGVVESTGADADTTTTTTSCTAASPSSSVSDDSEHGDDNADDSLSLHVPRERVSASEKASIEALLDEMVDGLLQSNVDLSAVASAVAAKPLRPLWFTTRSRIFVDMVPDYSDATFSPVICIGASDPDLHDTVLPVCHPGAPPGTTFTYCQGASDDEECWARGLTPSLFWANRDVLLAASPDRIAAVVDDVVRRTGGAHGRHYEPAESRNVSVGTTVDRSRSGGSGGGGAGDHDVPSRGDDDMATCNQIGSTGVFIGGRRAGRPPGCWERFNAVINVTPDEYDQNGRPASVLYLQLPVLEGKRDKHRLEVLLPTALRFAYDALGRGHRLLVHCAQGRDRSVGVAIAILAAFFDQDTGLFAPSDALTAAAKHEHDWHWRQCLMDRVTTKRRLDVALQWVLRHHPRASPSRHTLKKIQRFFLDDGPSTIAPHDLVIVAPPLQSPREDDCDGATGTCEAPEEASVQQEHDVHAVTELDSNGTSVSQPLACLCADDVDDLLPSDSSPRDRPCSSPGPTNTLDNTVEHASASSSSARDAHREKKASQPEYRRCFEGLDKVGWGRQSYWRLGEIAPRVSEVDTDGKSPDDNGVVGRGKNNPSTITIGLQDDKNPKWNCLKLVFRLGAGAGLDGTERETKVGYMLVEHPTPQQSCLRGMLVNEDLRGQGLSTVLVAAWLQLCLTVGATPSTNRIDKPLIALVLGKFGFVPAVGGLVVEVSIPTPLHLRYHPPLHGKLHQDYFFFYRVPKKSQILNQ